MALICSGQRSKADVLHETIEEYKEVYMRTKQQIQTLIDSVREYIEGGGNAAPPAAGGNAAGRRGNGNDGDQHRRGNNGDDDDDDDSDGHGGGPARGRGRGSGAAGAAAVTSRATAARALPAPRNAAIPSGRNGRGGDARPSRNASRSYSIAEENDENHDGSSGQSPDSVRCAASLADHSCTGPCCGCQLQAVERTVFKEGPNTGRKFWACLKQRDEGCGFFEWQDESNNGNGNVGGGYNRTVPKKRTAANIVRELSSRLQSADLTPSRASRWFATGRWY